MNRRDRGVALILVLGAVAILTVLAVELAARANQDVMMASRLSREAAFRRLFDSGAEVGRALLSEPVAFENYDFWGERWNEPAKFTLGPMFAARVRISDESGKINIAGDTNRGRLPGMLRRYFEYRSTYAPGKIRRWKEIEALVFIRLGLKPVPKDTEEDDRENASPPDPSDREETDETSKPDPLYSLDGLREAGLSMEEVFGKDGLAPHLTCFGDGKINLNTAPRAVLYSLSDDFDLAIVERIAEFRGGPDGGPGVYAPFTEEKDLMLVEGIVDRRYIDGQPRVTRNLLERVKSQISIESTAFGVEVQAQVGHRARTAWCFFEAEKAKAAGDEAVRRAVRFLGMEELLP